MPSASRGWHRRGFTIAVCSAVLALSLPAAAQSSADELARKHFESGAAYLEQSDYESSLREFQAAYDLSKRPEILINVATVHERLGHLEEAVKALEQYLKEAPPEGDRAETIKVRIDNLKKRRDEQKAQAPTPAPAAAPVPAPAPTPIPAAPPPPPPPAPESHGSSKVLPIVLLSAGGAFAIGSVVTGVLASKEHSDKKDSCSPNCTDSELSSGRTLALTSTILTGAAVVAGAVGAVLFFGSSDDAQPGKPAAFLSVTPVGVSAGSRWRF